VAIILGYPETSHLLASGDNKRDNFPELIGPMDRLANRQQFLPFRSFSIL
jgi:hypothetical protein